jgi:hypothetical protein
MSQENIKDNQEQAGAGNAPKPFDPTDEERIVELERRFGPKLESQAEKRPVPEGVMKLQGFEGAIAIKGEGNKYITLGIVGDDVWVNEHTVVLNDTIYDDQGGSKKNPNPTFEVMASNQISGALKNELLSRFGGMDGIISIISSMQDVPAVSVDTIERKNIEKQESLDRAEKLLMRLYTNSDLARDGFDPFSGRYNGESSKIIAETRKILESFSTSEQEVLADKFFEETIGRHISNNHKAYMVYGALRGTGFSSKFKELESARLRAGGYGDFKI